MGCLTTTISAVALFHLSKVPLAAGKVPDLSHSLFDIDGASISLKPYLISSRVELNFL